MTSKSFFLPALLLASLLAAAPASAQMLPKPPPPLPSDTQLELARIEDLGEVMRRAEQWRGEGDVRRFTFALERLVALRPYSPSFQYRLAKAYAQQGRKTETYDLLIRMQKQGLAINPDKDPDFDKVRDTPAFGHIVQGLEVNSTPWGEGKVTLTVPGTTELIESLAYDAKRKRFLLGSVRSGEVLAVGRDGKSSVLLSPSNTPGLKSIFALAVDEQRDLLWIGSGGSPQFVNFRASDIGTATLYKFDLAKGEVVEAYKLPFDGTPRAFAAIAVAKGGEVYATDPVSNVVYQVAGGELRKLFEVPGSTSLRGIAVDPQHKFLYFADYELGLRLADLSKSQVRELKMADQNLGGIDGLHFYDGHLLAIQNGSVPTRVLRVRLGEDLASLAHVQPLEANKDELEMPTYGALAGDRLYFIANSQRDLYAPDGRILPGEFAVPRKVYELSARFAWSDEDQKGTQVPMPAGQVIE